MIILNNISKGNIKDLSFYVSTGEIVCVNNPDCNKIKLLFSLMNGKETAEQGVIKYLDKGAYTKEIDKKLIGYVFQEDIMLKGRTLFENLEYIMQIKEIDMFSYKSRIKRILEIVELKRLLNKKPSQLMKHQLKRLNIAQAILNYPPILIVEEPIKELDQINSQGILRLLKRLNNFSMTVIILNSDEKIITGKDIRMISLGNNYDQKKKGYYV